MKSASVSIFFLLATILPAQAQTSLRSVMQQPLLLGLLGLLGLGLALHMLFIYGQMATEFNEPKKDR